MLRLYFLAVWATWEGKMSGLFSLAFTLAATYSTVFSGATGNIHAKVYLWIAAGLTFAFANYKSWEGEHKARNQAEALLADRQPNFLILVPDCFWEYDPTRDKTLFFASVNILNRGERSVAVGWGAKYIINGAEEEMEPYWIIGSYTIRVGTTQSLLTNSDLINAKTRTNPIERGALEEGRLFLAVDGDRRAQIDARTIMIQIRCLDVNFKSYTEMYTPSATKMKELRYAHTENVTQIALLP
jgi:hypothetical protein